MLDLDPKHLNLVRSILKKHIPNKEVWVYGSRVKGRAHSGSDLDLAIISPVTPTELSLVRTAFSESNLPISVDILDWETVPDDFKEEITKKHEVMVFEE